MQPPLRTTPPSASPRTPKPPWLKVPLPGGPVYNELKTLTRELGLNTVCESARCPNIGECWKGEHATLALPYVVITSVDRDDLPDGGSAHFAACIRAVRASAPRTVIETLIPDYQGTDLATLMAAQPDVLSHNVEVVPRLQRKIRDPRCSFERSLATLRGAHEHYPQVFTKSALMLGHGESDDEVLEALQLLRGAGVEFMTIGQYLRPSPGHTPVKRYVEPERFDALERIGRELGFLYTASGPLVRSSYKAGEFFAARLVRERRAASTANQVSLRP